MQNSRSSNSYMNYFKLHNIPFFIFKLYFWRLKHADT